MTAQQPEIIIYNNVEFFSKEEPLRAIIKKMNFRKRSVVTSLWRGYVGTWKVDNGNLYLESVYIPMRVNKNDIHSFFPDSKEPVLATWYSGVIEAFDIPPFSIDKYSKATEWVRLTINLGVVEKEEYCKLNDEVSKEKRRVLRLSDEERERYYEQKLIEYRKKNPGAKSPMKIVSPVISPEQKNDNENQEKDENRKRFKGAFEKALERRKLREIFQNEDDD